MRRASIIRRRRGRWGRADGTAAHLGEQLATTETLRQRFFSSPDASPARPAASLCICRRAGPGRTSSATPWHDCAPCPSHPDAIHGVRPLHRITQPPGRPASCRAPDALRLRSALKITPGVAATGRQPPLGLAAALRTVHFYQNQGLANPFTGPGLSSDRNRRIPSVDSGLNIVKSRTSLGE